MMKIAIIDNYDSFTYNLRHIVAEAGADVSVFRNDRFGLDDLEPFDKLLLSPGPGVPEEAGLLLDVIRRYAPSKPVLGICLGAQAIGEAFGGSLVNLEEVYHGVQTPVMIIPDLPFRDYLAEYGPVARKYGLHIIMLITPETSEERIRLIDEATGGFIYMVSSAAVTGVQKDFGRERLAYFHRISAMGLRNPRMIGFGISNHQTWQAAVENASGGIVGSLFVQLLEEAAGDADEAARRLTASLGLAPQGVAGMGGKPQGAVSRFPETGS